MLQFKNLKKFKNVVHGVSEVKEGSMNIFRVDAAARIQKLLKNTAFRNIKEDQMVFTENVHGNKIKRVTAVDGGSIKLGVDGLATNERELLLVVKSADCMPVLFYDPIKKVTAAIHCGFLGVVKKILPEAVKFFKKEFKSKPQNLIVGIGPHISQQNYKLHKEKLAIVKNKVEFKKFLKDGKFSIKDAGVSQLVKSGILINNIEVSNICTFANPKTFFSRRFSRVDPNLYKEENSMIGSFIGLR